MGWGPALGLFAFYIWQRWRSISGDNVSHSRVSRPALQIDRTRPRRGFP